MCSFDGLTAPEMTKTRRVIVLSPQSRTHFPDTFLVVPVTKTPPSPFENHHYEFKPRSYEFFDPCESVWALANMLTCVKRLRLDRVKINGRYAAARIRECDLKLVRQAVLHALGMDKWQQTETRSIQELVPVRKAAEMEIVRIDK